jgi:uracil-DNA glycosylase
MQFPDPAIKKKIKMATKDIFDDIISCLRLQAEHIPTTTVSENVLREFFTPIAKKQPKRTEAPNQTRHAPERNVQTSSAPSTIVSPHPKVDPANLSWHDLWQTAMDCRNCQLCQSRSNVVFGDGNQNADLMFIGEGPGRDEDAQGLPFVGKAGQLLNKMISAMQFTREEVYIANIIKCRPPQNRNPLPEEASACLPYLKRQIELVKPKVIVILGAVPLQFLFNQRGVTRLRGTWLDYHGIPAMITFHPAFLLRYPGDKGKAWSDLQQVMQKFGKIHKK